MNEANPGSRSPEQNPNSAEGDPQLSEEERLLRLTGGDSHKWFEEFSDLMESLGFYGAPEQAEDDPQEEPPRPADEHPSE
jgi:hypothetical protein